MIRISVPTALLSLALVTIVACTSDNGLEIEADRELVVRAVSTDALARVAEVGGGTGDPTDFTMGFYRFYLASNADCSSATLLADNGATPVSHDLLTNPTLFTVSGPPGTYNCIVMRISDVLTFTSASTFGPCVSGTTYQTDIYRNGETDWRDVDGNPVIGSGEDAAPVDNQVDVFFSTNPSSVIARGYSTNQVLQLIGGATIPGTTDFVYDLTSSVADEGGSCRALPGEYSFR